MLAARWTSQASPRWNVARRADVVQRSLGRRIRQLRLALGWSQEFLADTARMHRTYMWGIEQGVRNPSLRHLARIADAFQISLSVLFEGV